MAKGKLATKATEVVEEVKEAVVEVLAEPESTEPMKYIYKAKDNFTLGVKPSKRVLTVDGSGNTSWSAPNKGLKLVFNSGTAELNDTVAYNLGYSLDELKAMVDEYLKRNPNSGVKLVYETGVKPTKEQLDWADQCDKLAKSRLVKVNYGARTARK